MAELVRRGEEVPVTAGEVVRNAVAYKGAPIGDLLPGADGSLLGVNDLLLGSDDSLFRANDLFLGADDLLRGVDGSLAEWTAYSLERTTYSLERTTRSFTKTAFLA